MTKKLYIAINKCNTLSWRVGYFAFWQVVDVDVGTAARQQQVTSAAHEVGEVQPPLGAALRCVAAVGGLGVDVALAAGVYRPSTQKRR